MENESRTPNGKGRREKQISPVRLEKRNSRFHQYFRRCHALLANTAVKTGRIAMRQWKGSGGMLTSLNRLTGLPVVWRDRQMGYVERAVADVQGMRLHGLVVRKGIGAARWSPGEGVLLAGQYSVVLDRRPVRMPEAEPQSIRRAVFTTGGCAGEVSDVLIRSDTLAVAALEVSQGPVYRLMGRCAYAPVCRVNGDGEPGEVVVPQLLTWAQLLTQLGEEDGQ